MNKYKTHKFLRLMIFKILNLLILQLLKKLDLDILWTKSLI